MARANIHPAYYDVTITCITCTNSFKSGSTKNSEIRVDTCYNCHPFYTGKQIFTTATGRIERFKSKESKKASETETTADHKTKAKSSNSNKEFNIKSGKEVSKLMQELDK